MADDDPYRPRVHFTPPAGWMNDPNGLVWHQGRWHLFYQHHPHSLQWGPMHWGHASSTDLRRWQHHPVALAPDAQGMIFSGSAVADADGRLAALYTLHDAALAATGNPRHQQQALACSGDGGLSWERFAGNPVLPNPGAPDFRDPQLQWLPERRCWLMALAVGDHVAFHSSPDLKRWTHESDFGAGRGAHDGVWECPCLVPLELEGRTHWVLLVSLVNGGPAGGSATQYFIGSFDGRTFSAPPQPVRWLDHGSDDYAGVTWSHVPDGRAVFIAWMSNWNYAASTPTQSWRGAMTLPRELRLRRVGDELHLASVPAAELREWPAAPADAMALPPAFVVRLAGKEHGMTLRLRNDLGERLDVGYDRGARAWFIDRRASGRVDFHAGFAARHTAPRLARGALELELVIDRCSAELFADGGLSVITSLVFPRAPWRRLELVGEDGFRVLAFELNGFKD